LEDTELGRIYAKMEVKGDRYLRPGVFDKEVILLELKGGWLLRM
jgi:hypothetical protein